VGLSGPSLTVLVVLRAELLALVARSTRTDRPPTVVSRVGADGAR
jgi:hypothetical protein